MSTPEPRDDWPLLADLEAGTIAPADALRLLSSLLRVGAVALASGLVERGVFSPDGTVSPALGLCDEGRCPFGVGEHHIHGTAGPTPRLRLVVPE